jgi:hypothetical protein
MMLMSGLNVHERSKAVSNLLVLRIMAYVLRVTLTLNHADACGEALCKLRK